MKHIEHPSPEKGSTTVEPSVTYSEPVLKAQVAYDTDGWVDAVQFEPGTPTAPAFDLLCLPPFNGRARLLAHVRVDGRENTTEAWVTEPVTLEFRGGGASLEFSENWNAEPTCGRRLWPC